MNKTYYILQNGKAKAATQLEWTAWSTYLPNRLLAVNNIRGVIIYTICTGLNYQPLTIERPLIFKTNIFGGVLDGKVTAYSTREEALMGHLLTCESVVNHL